MKILRHAWVLYLQILWCLFHGSCEDKMASSQCEIMLRAVRTETSPTVFHELCFDNNSVTFVVKCDKIWYERILDFCSVIGLHIWDISMEDLLVSSPLTLQLVKSGKVVDSTSFNITSDHLVHDTIAVFGDHNTRFVLAVEKDCSMLPSNGASGSEQHLPKTSDKQALMNQSTPSVNTQHLHQSKFSQQEKGIINTTTGNFRANGLVTNSNTREGVLKLLHPVNTTPSVNIFSTNIRKCIEGDVHCSKSVDLSQGSKQFPSVYTSQSSYINDDPGAGGGRFIHDKIVSLKQRNVAGYFSSNFQTKTSEIRSTSVNVYASYNTLHQSNNVAHQYKLLHTLAKTPTVYPEIVPKQATSSDYQMLKSDEPYNHLDSSFIVSEHLTQRSNQTYRKHDTDKVEHPRNRMKRDTDKDLELPELFSYSVQPSSFSDKHSNLPAQLIDATHINDQLEIIKERTHSSHVVFESNSADSILPSLVNIQTSDYVLSTHSNRKSMFSNDGNTLQVSAFDIPQFQTPYYYNRNFNDYTVSADLSSSMLSENSFHDEFETQSASMTHNLVYSLLYNSPALNEAENGGLTLYTAIFAPSETLWTSVSTSSLGNEVSPYNQDDRASRVESTFLNIIPPHPFSMVENRTIFSSVSKTQWFEPQTPDLVKSYPSENSRYEQVTPNIVSALSSSFSYVLENEYSYVTFASGFNIKNTDNIDPSVSSSLIHHSPSFILSNSQETNIHPDPRLTASTASQSVASNVASTPELTSSIEYEVSSWTDQILLQSTTPPLIELTTHEKEHIASSLTDLTTKALIQLTKSSSWDLNNVYTTVEYSKIDHNKESLKYVTSITAQKAEINPSFENTGGILLPSDQTVLLSLSSDSHIITSPVTHQSLFDSSQTSKESISITNTFNEVSVTLSAVTEPEQVTQPTDVPTPSQNSSTLVTPQARHDDSSGLDDDKVWPIVAALVIGIPVVIVVGIAVTVIHRNSRLFRELSGVRILSSNSGERRRLHSQVQGK